MVADLATLREADVRSVLEGLEPSQRTRVEALLTSYIHGGADPVHTPPARLDGLSPWLQARLAWGEGTFSRPEAVGPAFEMTSSAVDALRECAHFLQSEQPWPIRQAPGDQGGWIARFKHRKSGRGASGSKT
jgi:hypothetical protein